MKQQGHFRPKAEFQLILLFKDFEVALACVCFSAFDVPGGLLMEWWSFFWDVYVARANERDRELAASPVQGLDQQTTLPIVGPPLQYNSPVPSVGDIDALLMGLRQQTTLPIVGPPLQYNSPVPSVGDMDALFMAAEHEIGPKREQPLPVVSPTINLDTPGPSSSSVSNLPAHLLRRATPVPSMSSPAFSADATDPLKLPTTDLADRDRFLDDGSSKDNTGSPLSRQDVITSSGVILDDHGKGSEGFSVKEIYLLPPGQSKVECCDFSSGGKFLVTGGQDNKATLWSTRSFSMMSILGEHSMCVTDVRFSPGIPRLGTCSADKTVRIWNINHVWAVGSDVKGQLVHEWHSSGKKFRSCVFHPRQPSVLMIGSYQNLELWDTKEDQKTSLLAHEDLISCLAASNVDGIIASASYDECVKIWN
ncbi:hypothetical protein CRG98_012893 [Punica granatum]|uniref:Uncharacterized protein n=1 Tax=Punica granatum TaxID=22663 RepID=A0A2I0KDV3_PUNGR|nr:hypothetical protein CRG98_012893 [Punica granatum]